MTFWISHHMKFSISKDVENFKDGFSSQKEISVSLGAFILLGLENRVAIAIELFSCRCFTVFGENGETSTRYASGHNTSKINHFVLSSFFFLGRRRMVLLLIAAN